MHLYGSILLIFALKLLYSIYFENACKCSCYSFRRRGIHTLYKCNEEIIKMKRVRYTTFFLRNN